MIDYHGHYVKHQVWERGYSQRETVYTMTLPKGLPGTVVENNDFVAVDATSKCVCHQSLPVGRYINHSSQPNLIHVAYTTPAGFDIIVFHATKKINQGQQLFFDYGSEFWNVSWYAWFKCLIVQKPLVHCFWELFVSGSPYWSTVMLLFYSSAFYVSYSILATFVFLLLVRPSS